MPPAAHDVVVLLVLLLQLPPAIFAVREASSACTPLQPPGGGGPHLGAAIEWNYYIGSLRVTNPHDDDLDGEYDGTSDGITSPREFSCLINVVRISPGCGHNTTRVAHHLMIVDRARGSAKFWSQNKPGFVSRGSARVVRDDSSNSTNWLISAKPSINESTSISESRLYSKFVRGDNRVSIDLAILGDDGLVLEAPNGSWKDASAPFPLSMFAHVARPHLHVHGSIELPEERHKLAVSGSMWEQHMWAGAPIHGGASVLNGTFTKHADVTTGNSSIGFVWHWFAMRFEGGMTLQCLATKEMSRPAPCVGVLSLRNDGDLPVPDLQLVSSSRPWTSATTNITYFTRNRFVSESSRLDVTLETVTQDNELPGADFPYYEAVSQATGKFRGTHVRGDGVTEKVMRYM
jgi:hypothetical protein